MKLCFIVNTVFAGDALKGQYSYYAVKEAYLKGYLKCIISTNYSESIINSNIIKYLPFTDLMDGILYKISKHSPIPFSSRVISQEFFDFRASKKIPYCDLLFSCPPIWVRSIKKAAEWRSLISVHDSTANLNYMLKLAKEEYGVSKTDINYYKKILISSKKVFKFSDWIFACSEFSKETHIKNGIPERKILVTNQGVDTKKFFPQKKVSEKDFKVAFVGASVVPLKGIKYLLEAWRNFPNKNHELIIYGNIDNSIREIFNYYKKYIKMNTPGFVNPSECYKNVSVLVFPSLTEGFEKVTMEAMASGIPIITTTNTGAAGIIKDGKEGFIVPIRDSNAIQKYIEYFHDNPNEIKRMGKNARILAEKFDWEFYSKHMCNLFEKIYESGRNK